MNAKATMHLKFQSRKQLESIFTALEPETRKPLTGRSKVKITKEGNVLNLTFEATDTSALRAATNSYLHWILLTKDALESIEAI